MSNAKGWVVLAVVFLSGLVLGASTATIWFTQTRPHDPRPAGPPRLEEVVDHLAHVVGLDEHQKAVALQAFRDHEPDMLALIGRQRQAMDAVLDATLAELRPSLTKEQNARLDAFVERIKQGPPLPPPGAPGMVPGAFPPPPGMGPDAGSEKGPDANAAPKAPAAVPAPAPSAGQ